MLVELANRGIGITALYYCPHRPDTGCACRKPAPGMLLRAAADHRLDLSQSWMIGDKPSDIEAARRAGIQQTVLIHAAGGQRRRAETRALHVCRSLNDATRHVVATAGAGPIAGQTLPPTSGLPRPVDPASIRAIDQPRFGSNRRDIA
jgi:histidinol phosphatase-like enzyme